MCSLPRTVSCRLCRGEKDCPYIVDRPLGRLIVHKREPTQLVVRDVVSVATGSRNVDGFRNPIHQRLLAALAWIAIPILVWWTVFVLRPNGAALLIPAALMAITFIGRIIGVPIVRSRWDDRGGVRKGGPWRPS